METWEYMIESGIKSRDDVVQFLNRMGAQGWEAVSVQWVPPTAFFFANLKTYWVVSLKRRKP